ncbi:MAG: ABC transporter permease [Candidatus Sumerlaeia bacterium]
MASPENRKSLWLKAQAKKFSWEEAAISLGIVLLIFAVWYVVAWLEIYKRYFVPTPYSVWKAFLETCTVGYRGKSLLEHFEISMVRVLVGFLAACATAIPLGLAMGWYPRIRALFDPLLEFYRPLPPLAYYTLLIIWLGIEDESKIALLYLAAFPPLALSARAGVKRVSEERIHGAQSLGANRWQVFRHVVFPSCLPEIFTGMRVAIGFTYTTLVASEMVAARSGLGWMVLDAYKYLRSDVVFMGIIVLGLTGIVLDRLLRLAEHLAVPWKGKET